MPIRVGVLLHLLCLAPFARAAPVELTLTVDNVARTAIVHPGATADRAPAPVVFAFHGFTGNARQMALSSRIHTAWPTATVVYPQGLPRTMLGRTGPGWQTRPGDTGDRDLRFVDALLQALPTRWQVDTRRLYVTGMSNGAIFAYAIFAARGTSFAAFAPVAGYAVPPLRDVTPPRPFLIIQGTRDRLVPLNWAEMTRDALRRVNGCGAQTVEWAPGYLSYQPCASGMPVIWHAHPGGHLWPADATAHIVKFFMTQALPAQ